MSKRTNGAKLPYFILFVAVNGLSCVFIPFLLDYAHNFLNSIIIPKSLLWDTNNHMRADRSGWYTVQLLMIMAEFVGLLWLLYRFNWQSTHNWLVEKRTRVTRSVTWLIVAVVAIVTLFGRGGFLIWLVKHYVKNVV